MRAFDAVVDAIWQAIAEARAVTAWEVGTVASVEADGTATVTVADADFPGLHHAARYTPAKGDTVVLLSGGQQLLILDKIV